MFGLLQVMGSFQLTSGPPSPPYKVRQDKSKITIIGFGSALVEGKRRRKARVSGKQINKSMNIIPRKPSLPSRLYTVLMTVFQVSAELQTEYDVC
jgi:hypothetical protein